MRGVKKWLEIYTYRVLINGSLSKWKGVLSDILQESVLSLHLFNIFINKDDGIGSMFIRFAEDMEQGGTTSSLKIQNELVYWRNILKISRKMNGTKFVREKKQSKYFSRNNQLPLSELGGNRLGTNFTDKDLRVIADLKVDMSQQCHF